MPIYRLEYHTGPVDVDEIGQAARKTGYPVVIGTEHIYVDVPIAENAYTGHANSLFLRALEREAGTTFGLVRPRRLHRREANERPIVLVRQAKRLLHECLSSRLCRTP